MRNHNKLLVTLAVSMALHGIHVFAEEAEKEEEAGLNVVTVTAQKRSESAQDIPISLNVLSSEQLFESGIEKIDDLQYKIPNLQMTETGISTQMYVRGIGTGNNQGFEQSVGQYIDGIYYGRQQLIRAPFLDLERVEVLKGPQSILFGKNSIAGALNMTSAKPSEDLELKASLQFVPEFGGQEFTGAISGGLSENFSARLAVRNYTEDGYVNNSFRGRDEVIRDEQAVRASFRWTPNDDIDILLKVEQDNFEGNGRQIEIIRDDPNLVTGLVFAQYMGIFGHPNAITESEINFERQADDGDTSDNELNNITLSADFGLGDYTLTSITGVVSYEFSELCDCDYVAAPVFDAFINEEYDQFSQELRIVSPVGGAFDWVGGFFYQTSEVGFNDNIILPTSSIFANLPTPASLDFLGETTFVRITGKGAGRRYENDSDLWAVFFQGRFHLGDDWALTLGGRFTSESKTASREINVTELATGENTEDGIAAALFNFAFGIQNQQSQFSPEGHSLTGSRDESSFTPQINLQYKASDDVMFYGAATTGFKSGGFDARANNINSWEFEEEEATSFELGMKSSLLENTLEANISFYRTEYDNLQVSQFDGRLGFNVGNAKETLVQGIEVDGRWLIAESFAMNYAFAFLDHEFKDFTNGNCYNRQVPDGDIGDDGNQLCDYTGKSGQYTPSFTGSLGMDYDKQINMGIFDYFRASLGLYHSSGQNVDVNLNPLYDIDAYTKVDFRLALEGQNFSVALFGKNVTDEEILTYVGNVPLSGSSFGTNTFYGFVDRPAAYGIQLSYEL